MRSLWGVALWIDGNEKRRYIGLGRRADGFSMPLEHVQNLRNLGQFVGADVRTHGKPKVNERPAAEEIFFGHCGAVLVQELKRATHGSFPHGLDIQDV